MFLYIRQNTFLHRLHPATKIVSLILLLVITVALDTAWQQLIVLGVVLCLVVVSRSARNLRRILPLMITIMVFSCITWSLFKRVGDPFWSFGIFQVSRESIQYGIAMGLRLVAMLSSGVVFVSCTKVEEFAFGMRALGLPFPVSFALSLAFRLVPLFFARITIVVQAQQARGLDLHSGHILQRARKYIPLLVPIFIYAIRDTDLLAMALESKGFGMQGKRTEYQRFILYWYDYGLIFLLLLTNVYVWTSR